MEKIYYENDADVSLAKKLKIGIIGYGIQGRAQALNLRDSGINVAIANRGDHYLEKVKADGFENLAFDELVKMSDIILLLIPDQAQKAVFDQYICPHLRSGQMLVVAHGFSLRFNKLNIPSFIDVTLLAPRMPGMHIRKAYLADSGVPAFVDVVQDASGHALSRILSVAKGIGYTRSGVLAVNYKIETDLDLFIEQFLVTNIVKSIKESYEVLINEFDYPKVATLLELYASSELGEVIKQASKIGIGQVFQQNASPTCQFGIAKNYSDSLEKDYKTRIREVVQDIQSGNFAKALDQEGDHNYPKVNKLWDYVANNDLQKTQDFINQNFKWPNI